MVSAGWQPSRADNKRARSVTHCTAPAKSLPTALPLPRCCHAALCDCCRAGPFVQSRLGARYHGQENREARRRLRWTREHAGPEARDMYHRWSTDAHLVPERRDVRTRARPAACFAGPVPLQHAPGAIAGSYNWYWVPRGRQGSDAHARPHAVSASKACFGANGATSPSTIGRLSSMSRGDRLA